MIKTISDWLCSLVINGYIVPIMIILALIIVLLIAVLLEDDIKKKNKNNKIEIELEEERIDVKELILRMEASEIAEKYSEDEITIKGVVKRYRKKVEERTREVAKFSRGNNYDLFTSAIQYRLDLIGMLFMMRKLKEHKEDTKELINLLKEEVESFEEQLKELLEEE